MVTERITALVPMKGHSARVPGKNLRILNGRPLFYWIVKALQDCPQISQIVIDTDSDEIISSVKSLFDKIIFLQRPPELIGDAVSMNDILKFDLSRTDGEHFLQTHSTNPLLTTETIVQAVHEYFSCLGKFDSLFSVSKIQARCFTPGGIPLNHNPYQLIQTQCLQPVLVENSNIYIFSRETFEKTGRRIGEKPLLFELDEYEAIDIDTENDFVNAEILCAAKKGYTK